MWLEASSQRTCISYDQSLHDRRSCEAKAGANVSPRCVPHGWNPDCERLHGNHVAICFAQAKRQVEALGGVMLPFGLECQEAVTGVAKEAARIPVEICAGTVVLCCGSGVTLAGLLTGLKQLPQRLIGISSGRSLTRSGPAFRGMWRSLLGASNSWRR
jgi:hypothetical protein